MTPTFAVLLARPEKRDAVALAKALATARKTPLQDQIMAAKSCWGIVSETLGEGEAQALKSALVSAGVEAVVCEASTLATLPAAAAATTLPPLLASKPTLIAAAAITVHTTTTKTVKQGPSAADKIMSAGIFLATGLPIHIGGKERTVEKTQHQSDLAFYIDAIYENPLRRLRVNALHFDYSFLKERKLYQILGNFKLLLGDVVKSAPEAWQNHGTKIFLSNQPLQSMGYESLADLERETRWLLALKGC